MNYLKLYATQRQYPYQDESYNPNLLWSEIKLKLISEHSLFVKEIISFEWEFMPLLDWLLSNRLAIVNNNFPIESEESFSISKKIYNFNNSEEDYEDEVYESIYNYRLSHALRFGLRGVDMDDIYIGKNNNIYEISYYNIDSEWCFDFDINSFYNDLCEFL